MGSEGGDSPGMGKNISINAEPRLLILLLAGQWQMFIRLVHDPPLTVSFYPIAGERATKNLD